MLKVNIPEQQTLLFYDTTLKTN